MSYKLGFLGNGNMGYAILKGLIQAGVLKAEDAAVYDIYSPAVERAAALGVHPCNDIRELAAESDAVLAAVKPQNAEELFMETGKSIKDHLLISIVAGYDVAAIRSALHSESARVLRVMPNTPAMVSAGVFGLDAGTDATEEEKRQAENWFSAIGSVFWVGENLFPAITGLSGSGPAYVDLFIEALADAGVREGLKRADALKIAAQTVYGSAKLILDENLHPAVAKDQVCSPAGTTIEGVKALEERAFRATVMSAIAAGTEKAKNLK